MTSGHFGGVIRDGGEAVNVVLRPVDQVSASFCFLLALGSRLGRAAVWGPFECVGTCPGLGISVLSCGWVLVCGPVAM
jgi:hypothetical protein